MFTSVDAKLLQNSLMVSMLFPHHQSISKAPVNWKLLLQEGTNRCSNFQSNPISEEWMELGLWHRFSELSKDFLVEAHAGADHLAVDGHVGLVL